MAGGTFDKNVGKARPGTYVNFISTRTEQVSGGPRGAAIIPLAGTDYGPAKTPLKITAAAPDEHMAKLGHSVLDIDNGNMLMIREALKGANTVYVYIVTEGTAAAQGTGGGLKGVAKYKGTRGNKLKYSVVANPAGGFDVDVILDGTVMESFDGVTTVAELAGSEYITFTAAGEDTPIAAVAGVSLAGGTDAEATDNAGVTAFLDDAENLPWDTMAFPFTAEALQAALKSKIKYLREECGKGVQAVAPNFAADYEGIINLSNAYALDSIELTTAQATAFVAGATAGASNVESLTYRQVTGATAVVGRKTNEAAAASIRNGEMFFSVSEDGSIIIEYDVNSLVTIPSGKDKSYKKNRVIRELDTFRSDLVANFPPNKFDNDEEGWDIMKGVGKSLLMQHGPRSEGGVGAIQNVDYDNDFQIDETMSTGDETYFNVAIQPIDSSEKLYFTVTTR